MSGMLPSWAFALTVTLLMSIGWAALVFLSAAAVERLVPSAADRHMIWLAALLLCVLPVPVSLLPFVLPSWGGPPEAPGFALGAVLGAPAGPASGAATVAEPAAFGRLIGPAMPLLLVVYGAGLALCAASWIGRRQRLAALLAGCRPLDEPAIVRAAADWAARLGVRSVPRLLVAPGRHSPFVTGWGRPLLVLPEALISTPERASLVCAHELAHLRRGDAFFISLQNVIAALLWFNPCMPLILRRLNASREAACDAMVLSHRPAARRPYAAALLDCLRLARESVPGIPFIRANRKDHEMRLAAILRFRPGNKRAMRAALCCLLLTTVLAPLAAVQAALAKEAAGSAAAVAVVPVVHPKAWLSSGFGPRVHPFTGKDAHHDGVDIAAPRGTAVKAAGRGKVLHAGEKGAYGLFVEIDHGDGWRTRYGQLDSIGVKTGALVAEGQRIGTVGSSGTYSSGPHLHLEVWHDGKPVDPATVLTLPDGKPKRRTN